MSELFPRLLAILPLFRLRRLRLVAPTHESFDAEFTPEALAYLLMRLPHLEELVLDGQECPEPSLTSWTMVCTRLTA